MNIVFVTQRVDILTDRNEVRDCLDQRWNDLLMHCGILPVVVPNDANVARTLLDKLSPSGLLLTGGNNLEIYGGDAPERDETERMLVDKFRDERKPILGVCRGMQLLQHIFGQQLEHIDGHVAQRIKITYRGVTRVINSYHTLGAYDNTTEFSVDARSSDNVIKAISHPTAPIVGIMWHPEREATFCEHDVQFMKEFFHL